MRMRKFPAQKKKKSYIIISQNVVNHDIDRKIVVIYEKTKEKHNLADKFRPLMRLSRQM